MPIRVGPITTILERLSSGGGFQGAAWGEDGTIVVATGTYRGLVSVPDIGGTPIPITTVSDTITEFHGAPHFLPGAQSLLFSIRRTGQPTGDVALLRIASGEYEILTTGDYPHYVAPGYMVVQRADALWAASFDAEAGRVTGDFVPVQEGVQSDPFTSSYTVSLNGSLVFAPLEDSGGSRTLVWVDRDGSERRVEIDPEPYVYPRISPGGDQLAVAQPEDIATLNGAADLWVIDLDRLTRTRVTFGGNNRFFPTWTPDGASITYADGSGGTTSLLWASVDGTRLADTLLGPGDRRFPTSWSPDGRTLAYYMGPLGTPTSSRDIWTLELDGDRVTHSLFLATPYQDRAPTFSPDGRWLAYVSDKSGRDEVYVAPYPGPGRELTISAGGGREPVWSRNGTELFYRSDDLQQLMAVAVQPDERFRADTPRSLFADVYERDTSGNGPGGIANYDVVADGSRFIMVRAPDREDYSVVVVLNWVEELERLIAN
jgi:Tol biopolymer transport system component